VKYLNLSFNEEEIDYDELMSSSTMAGSPHGILVQNELYIESNLLLIDLLEQLNLEKSEPKIKLYSNNQLTKGKVK
jgi:hypothetical protein